MKLRFISSFTLLPWAIAVASTAMASHVYANSKTTTVEEIIVTGELRQTSALTIANSVAVMDQTQIEARQAQNLEDILNLAANVNFSTGASRGRFIQIRGIGERSQYVDPVNPSVGIMVDGIDFTGIGTGVTALDAQQIEIFRGPQATLFGANALAGMINVKGNAPRFDAASARIKLGAGNYNSRNSSAVLNTPLGESVAWRFGIQQSSSDGYMQNDYLNRKDTNDIDELSLRNHLLVKPSDALQFNLVSYFIDANNGYDAFSLANNRHTLSDQPGQDIQKTTANALSMNYSGLNVFDVSATLTHADSDLEYGFDEDWSYINICAIDDDCAYWQYSTTDNYLRANKNSTLDVRLHSKNAASLLHWSAGFYHRTQDVDLTRIYTNNLPDSDPYSPIVPVATLYSSDFITHNSALYGELIVDLSARLSLVTGLRYEQYDSEFNDTNKAFFEPEDDFFGGKIALEFQMNSDTLLYGLVSRGYKTGGFNANPRVSSSKTAFKPESMLNYEMGSKGSWLQQSLVLQTALFYQQRQDIQIKQSGAVAGVVPVEFIEFLDNAEGGDNYGAELEAKWTGLNDRLEVFGSLGLLHTAFDHFDNYSHVKADKENAKAFDMTGREQPHAPSYQWLFGSQWNILPVVYVRAEAESKDSFYFSASHEEQSEFYTLFNASFGYVAGPVSIAVWGKNLTDVETQTRGFYFANDPRDFYANAQNYTQKGAPRTVGMSAVLEF